VSEGKGVQKFEFCNLYGKFKMFVRSVKIYVGAFIYIPPVPQKPSKTFNLKYTLHHQELQ